MSNIHVNARVKLQNIDASSNHLSTLNIGPAYLLDVTSLKLNDNHLWEITTGFLAKLEKLKSLYVESNVLRLYENMFKSLTELRALSLAQNHLYSIDITWFKGLNNLTHLDLEENFLKSINYTELLTTLPSLQTFFVDNNAFSCTFIENMVNYIRNTTSGKSIEFTNTGRGKFPSCVSDEHPNDSYWGWIFTGIVMVLLVGLVIAMRHQLVERFNEVRRRLTSYNNMRETEQHGSGPLADSRSED